MSKKQIHDEEVLGKAYDARLMKRLLKYTKPYRMIVAFAVSMLVLTALFQTALAFITKIGIDDYILTGTIEGFDIDLLSIGVTLTDVVGSGLQKFNLKRLFSCKICKTCGYKTYVSRVKKYMSRGFVPSGKFEECKTCPKK